MAHRLLVPPYQCLRSTIRLPTYQKPGEAIASNLTASLVDRDSLRRYRTTGNGKALGPLPAVQTFLMSEVGSPNTPESMASGVRARNAGRLSGKTRGQSAGM